MPQVYKVVLTTNLIASSIMDAAYQAIKLAESHKLTIEDVVLNEQETGISKQLGDV